jgi:hypothetical protein
MAAFTFQKNVCHELHLYLDLTFTLTGFAASTLNVEREV